MAIDLWTILQMMFLREANQFLETEIDQLKKSEMCPKLEDRHASIWKIF